jgi:trigger factor
LSTETKTDTAPATGEPAHDHTAEHHHHGPEFNEACKREVSVEIPADVIRQETARLVRKYQKLARIPGFRAGKVPESIVRSRFADDIRSEMIDALLPQYFRAAVEKQGLVPVSQPYVSDLQFTEGEPVRFNASFEVLPKIEVSGYKGLHAERKDFTVSDDEVTEALKELQERQSSYEPVDDRELREGDFASVSFSGLSKGTAKIAAKKAEVGETESEASAPPAAENKPIEVNDVLVEIGGANTVKEFTENLLGAKPGDERKFDVSYPEDFSDQRLAGQVMSYTVKVGAVKKKVMPELTDDFAKEIGDFASIDKLRQRIRSNMEAEKKHSGEHAEKEKLIDQLVEKNDFPVPQALIDRQIDVRLDRGFRALAAQGMRTEDMRKMNFARLREGQKAAAVREVKASLLLDKIAEVESIEVSDADVERELQSAAQQSGQSVESIRERLSKDGSLDRIRDRIRNEKALAFIYEQSA